MEKFLKNVTIIANPLAGTVINEKQNFYNDIDYTSYFGPSQIVGTFITLFALYLVFKCSKTQGHNMILNFIAALCCAPFYIIYRLFIAPC